MLHHTIRRCVFRNLLPSESALQKTNQVARAPLSEVIASRGLNIRLADYIPFDEVEWQEMVTIRRF